MVTIGTAGKLFHSEPGTWRPLPRPNPIDLAAFIDHSCLSPEAEKPEIEKLCREAREFKFAAVCIHPAYVAFAKNYLEGSTVKVCAVAGFPLGATLPAVKANEALECVRAGADEIDMVLNIGALKSGEDAIVFEEIAAVRMACFGKILKVILETCLLSTEEKVRGALLSRKAGADFVKTSTGFSRAGATVGDVILLRKTVGPEIGIKASGGIRTREFAEDLVRAGATRLGTSNSVRIVSGRRLGF